MGWLDYMFGGKKTSEPEVIPIKDDSSSSTPEEFKLTAKPIDSFILRNINMEGLLVDVKNEGQPEVVNTALGFTDLSVKDWDVEVEGKIFKIDNEGAPDEGDKGQLVTAKEKALFKSVLNQLGRLPLERIHHYALNGEYAHALMRDRKLVDLLIHVGDNSYYAHRLVVCSHSKNFGRLLLSDESPPNTITDITIKSVTAEKMREFIYFAYTGELQLNENTLLDWIELAKQLDSPSLQSKIQVYLGKVEPMALEQAMIILLKDKTDFSRPIAIKAVSENFHKLLDASDSLYQLSPELLMEILGNSNLSVLSELDVFWGALFWVAYDVNNRAIHLDELMTKVRFSTMSSLELMDCARASNLIRLSDRCKEMLMAANWVCHARETGLEDPLDMPKDTKRTCLLHPTAALHEPTVAEFDLRYLHYSELLADALNPNKPKKYWFKPQQETVKNTEESKALHFTDELGKELEDHEEIDRKAHQSDIGYLHLKDPDKNNKPIHRTSMFRRKSRKSVGGPIGRRKKEESRKKSLAVSEAASSSDGSSSGSDSGSSYESGTSENTSQNKKINYSKADFDQSTNKDLLEVDEKIFSSRTKQESISCKIDKKENESCNNPAVLSVQRNDFKERKTVQDKYKGTSINKATNKSKYRNKEFNMKSKKENDNDESHYHKRGNNNKNDEDAINLWQGITNSEIENLHSAHVYSSSKKVKDSLTKKINKEKNKSCNNHSPLLQTTNHLIEKEKVIEKHKAKSKQQIKNKPRHKKITWNLESKEEKLQNIPSKCANDASFNYKTREDAINLWQSSVLESPNIVLLKDSVMLPIKNTKVILNR